MSGMELNKIMAAVLVAGIVASLSGFIARETVHPHALHEDAVAIEASGGAGHGGGAKEKMPEPILELIAGADVARGEKVAKACAACHSFDKNGANGTGPNLWNVVGRAKSSKDGFDYSDGMKGFGGNWSYAELNQFIWKPKAYVAGTKMNYVGLKKPEDRAALIAWLRSLSDPATLVALPNPADIAAEKAALGVEEAHEQEENYN